LRVLERLFPVLSEPSAAYPLSRQLVVAHAVQGVQVHDTGLVALMVAHELKHILTFNSNEFSYYHALIETLDLTAATW
jgi:hypothetical protein